MASSLSLVLIPSLLLLIFARFAAAGVLFSSLPRSLIVQASPKPGDVLKAGENQVTVTWELNQTFPAGTDDEYKTVEAKLCFAPISQTDRSWRKSENDISKDKTCQFKITAQPYLSSDKNSNSFSWVIERDIPTATYFVRAYALNSNGVEMGYGQSSNSNGNSKTPIFFEIKGITGRHASLDIAAACFSAFSVVSLLGFFVAEKRKAKRAQNN